MQPRNNSNPEERNESGLEQRLTKVDKINQERDSAEAAHEQADHDIDEDPDLSLHSPNDDLDEGETARLGEKTDLI